MISNSVLIFLPVFSVVYLLNCPHCSHGQVKSNLIVLFTSVKDSSLESTDQQARSAYRAYDILLLCACACGRQKSLSLTFLIREWHDSCTGLAFSAETRNTGPSDKISVTVHHHW